MREILFRGKQENNEWAKGSLIIWGDGSCSIEAGTLTEPMASVIPETVGQYTGLTDKNGKEIFEGDILDCGDRVVYVKWHDFCGTWDSIFIKYKGELHSNGVSVVDWKYRAIIIGNIHDNPELLKDGE